MKPEILILTPIYSPTVQALERDYVVHKLWEQPDPDEFLRRGGGHIRGAVTSGVVGYKRRDLENFINVGVVACFGVAHGTLDLSFARERGIVVTNTPDSSADTVADLAMGLMLSVMRRIGEGDRFVRAGAWERGNIPFATSLRGRTCGIVGLGNIGRGIASRAAACGMSICYFGPRRKADVAYTYYDDLATMARQSDCLVLSCPDRPETRDLITADVLRVLGKDGFLVNIARGVVVDETALIEALAKGVIAGAGLDVFVDEPRVPARLRTLDNVVLTPHIGTWTRDIREERSALVINNLRAFFADKPVLTPVA